MHSDVRSLSPPADRWRCCSSSLPLRGVSCWRPGVLRKLSVSPDPGSAPISLCDSDWDQTQLKPRPLHVTFNLHFRTGFSVFVLALISKDHKIKWVKRLTSVPPPAAQNILVFKGKNYTYDILSIYLALHK